MIIKYGSVYRNHLNHSESDKKQLTSIKALHTKINSDTWICHIQTAVKCRVTRANVQLLKAVYDALHQSRLKRLLRHSAPVMTKSRGQPWIAFHKHWPQQCCSTLSILCLKERFTSKWDIDSLLENETIEEVIFTSKTYTFLQKLSILLAS